MLFFSNIKHTVIFFGITEYLSLNKKSPTAKLVPAVEDLRAEDIGTKTATIKWSVSGESDDYDVIKNFVVKYWRIGAKRRTLRRLTKS